MNTEVLLGQVAVDSGQLMVVDPQYVLDGEFEDSASPYGAMCAVIHGTLSRGGEWSPYDSRETAVGTMTNGDGLFPVFAEKNPDGAIVALHVRLMK